MRVTLSNVNDQSTAALCIAVSSSHVFASHNKMVATAHWAQLHCMQHSLGGSLASSCRSSISGAVAWESPDQQKHGGPWADCRSLRTDATLVAVTRPATVRLNWVAKERVP